MGDELRDQPVVGDVTYDLGVRTADEVEPGDIVGLRELVS
ncbi:MAG: hypothetical protein ETSY1_02520 [Candidatus Entotheonella factor]|uniref:Uncharacterized protein n=1 Tax=Entotheonella factor TaxID=1429438 RepID=W4LX99_ENTF1|nr:MAG: hypothetical protein ETSY1_02520 [Candidatus Entotheonella factor]